ncbi:MAG: TusE/DsrC/DsvC family sulfur relay protein [Thermoproteus sp.]
MTDVRCPGTYKIADKDVKLDEDCYLEDPSNWDREVARWIAENLEGISLTAEHWRAVEYVRSYWEKHGECPPVSRLLRDLGMTFEDLYRLFPSGPAEGLCRVAGVPRPGGCS